MDKEKLLKKEIIGVGRKLHASGFLTARAGNLSCRLGNDMLITASGSCLGDLTPADIVKTGIFAQAPYKGPKKPSSELPVHSLIYREFPDNKIVLHCHPPLANAYFAVYPSLKVLTFETRYYLGDVPVVEQGTLTVRKPRLVIAALKQNSLAVIRSHGVFAIGNDFQAALERVEILEEAVRVAAVARIFKKESLDVLDRRIKKCLSRKRR
ncbi:MAG: class II aldolase/adducin family protein [Candidatus Omnitrophica bacterium]|jgi:L-fuculose-phosphate aldolase|nr:class II aldolase/adducin family protein [Candidatus Omnitrophota bacterium]MDD5079450.1 class II aldolase/adducin family protein [Candidatus Omnitrophota bacterium]